MQIRRQQQTIVIEMARVQRQCRVAVWNCLPVNVYVGGEAPAAQVVAPQQREQLRAGRQFICRAVRKAESKRVFRRHLLVSSCPVWDMQPLFAGFCVCDTGTIIAHLEVDEEVAVYGGRTAAGD